MKSIQSNEFMHLPLDNQDFELLNFTSEICYSLEDVRKLERVIAESKKADPFITKKEIAQIEKDLIMVGDIKPFACDLVI